MNHEDLKLKTLYSEILRGYSFWDSLFFGPIYFKHFTPDDFSFIDIHAEDFYNKAIKAGISSKEERINDLKQFDLWPHEDERNLNELKAILQNQYQNKKRETIPSRIDMLNNAIKDNEARVAELETKFNEIIGQTAETYSARKTNELFAYMSSYKDKTLETPKFTKEEFDELEEKDLAKLIISYNDKITRITPSIIREIALKDFFMSYFSICKNNPFIFYGKSVCQLSSYQTELFVYASNFRAIISRYGDEIPDDVQKDHKRLTEWYESRTIAEKGPKGVDTNANFSVPGAKKEDYEKWGYNDKNAIDLSKEARKRGKPLSMQEIMQMRGT